MTASQIDSHIDKVMPQLARPPLDKIVTHSEGCFTCEFLLRDLLAYKDTSVTPELLLRVCDEQSALTPEAYRWILPEYLKAVLKEDTHEMVLDHFVYSLSPEPQFVEEAHRRMALLTHDELAAIRFVLSYLQRIDFWLEDNLSQALAFTATIMENNTPQSTAGSA